MTDNLLEDRGITKETQEAFGVWRDTDTWCFPYALGKKYRAEQNGKRKFWFDGELSLFCGDFARFTTGCTIICEGETDTMRMQQEYPEALVLGLPGINTWKDEWKNEIPPSFPIYVVVDNPKQSTGYKEPPEDQGWAKIKKSLPKAKRIKLPNEVKDVCEYFDLYDIDHFKGLMEKAQVPTYNFPALDLTQDPPAVDWLVEGLFAKGDLVILMSEPNVGKTFLGMDLGVKIIEKMPWWVGHKVYPHTSKIMVVDNENPLDVVYNRMYRLGMTKEGAKNVRYLHGTNLRLDKDADRLLEDAMLFQPDLILVDSLTRMHGKNENSAGEINALFNDSLFPLARTTNACVIFLHHAGKSDSNNSFVKSRGSSDIIAAPDGGFELRAMDGIGNRLNLINFKKRRGIKDKVIRLTLNDVDDRVVIDVDKGEQQEGEPF